MFGSEIAPPWGQCHQQPRQLAAHCIMEAGGWRPESLGQEKNGGWKAREWRDWTESLRIWVLKGRELWLKEQKT